MRKWTPEELALLREKYPSTPVDELAELLGRQPGGIKVQAQRQNVSQRSRFTWTEEQIQEVLALARNEGLGTGAIAKRVHRPLSSVSKIVCKHGLSKEHHQKWTNREEDFIRKNFSNLHAREIANALGRTIVSVHAKLKKMHLHQIHIWTEEEIVVLRQNYSIRPIKEVAEILGMRESCVFSKARKLGLVKYNPKTWTEPELALLRELSVSEEISAIAKRLGRSESNVAYMCAKLNLPRKHQRTHHKVEDFVAA
jgi:hypothetical protein